MLVWLSSCHFLISTFIYEEVKLGIFWAEISRISFSSLRNLLKSSSSRSRRRRRGNWKTTYLEEERQGGPVARRGREGVHRRAHGMSSDSGRGWTLEKAKRLDGKR